MKMNKLVKASILCILICSMVLLSGCVEKSQTTQTTEQNKIENNQNRLLNNQPIPALTKSLERENLINRLRILNDDSKVFYVYLISYGKIMAFYTAKGKVSSLNSYLNSQLRVVRDDECYRHSGSSSACSFVLDTPDADGSYGKNADGVFFFTTEGIYVETTMDYMTSDYPLKLSQPPEMTRVIQ